MDKIFAVVLSYKRKEMLKRCLEAVSLQTRPCDGIIVVDNASHDGTEDMLQQLPLANLKVYVLSRNTGASGGFSAGFRIAYQLGADFVWMMDDDVTPELDALEQLTEADERLRAHNQPRSFLLSRAYTHDGLLTNVPRIDERTNEIDYENWPALLDIGVIPVRPATFVSILVPRESLERYGLPLAPMFMWGDDTEFTLRISQHAPGYLVPASKVIHSRRVSGTIDIRRETDPARISLHRHFVRNELFVARRYSRKRRVVGVFGSNLVLITQLIRLKQFSKAKVVLLGLWEAFRFNPQVEAADAAVEALGVSVRQFSPALAIVEQAEADKDLLLGGDLPDAEQQSDHSELPVITPQVPRVLVCGAGGQVGQCLLSQAASFGLEAVGLSHEELDISCRTQINQALERYRPVVIINAAAYTNLDHAEAEIAQAEAVNRNGAANLAEAATAFEIPLIHLSSEYVFSGSGDRPYRETDPTLPASVYGATRLAGEEAIKSRLDRHLILRTSWLYGEQGNNFVKTMLKLACKSDEISVVGDQIGCPTRARSVARVMIELAARYCREGTLQWGLYHYSGSSPCSWAEFAEEIFREAARVGLIEKMPRVFPIPSERLPRAAARLAWSVLDCRRIEEVFGIRAKPWRDELRHVIRDLNDLPDAARGPAPSRVPFRLYSQG